MKRWLVAGAVGVVVVAAGCWLLYGSSALQKPCHFPPSITSQAGSLKLYCIDERQLPAGVSSGTQRASYGQGAVLYTLQDAGSQLSISEQAKPPAKQLANFVPNIIPLNFNVTTPVGTDAIGVHAGNTLVSLPTKSNTWILITGPGSYSPDRMTQLLKLFVAN